MNGEVRVGVLGGFFYFGEISVLGWVFLVVFFVESVSELGRVVSLFFGGFGEEMVFLWEFRDLEFVGRIL